MTGQLRTLPEYSQFFQQYAQHPNPMASTLAAICFNQERHFLNKFVELTEEMETVNVSVFMFDGVVLNLLTPEGAG